MKEFCLTFSVSKAAQLIGCAECTVRSMMADDKLKGYRSENGRNLRPSLFSILVDVLRIPEREALEAVLRSLASVECSGSPSCCHRPECGPGNVVPSPPGQPSEGTMLRTSEDHETIDPQFLHCSLPSSTSSSTRLASPATTPEIEHSLAIFRRTAARKPAGVREGSA